MHDFAVKFARYAMEEAQNDPPIVDVNGVLKVGIARLEKEFDLELREDMGTREGRRLVRKLLRYKRNMSNRKTFFMCAK